MDLRENIRRIQEVMGLIIEQETNDCLNRFKPVVDEASNWWKNWLNHPVTQEKWDKLYGGEKMYKDVLPSWLNVLNKIQIIPYDQNTKEFFCSTKKKFIPDEETEKVNAFVYPKDCLNDIFVNCEKKTGEELSTMIHEIQHLLNFQHPINNLTKFKEKYNTTSPNLQQVNTEQEIIDKIGKVNADDLKKIFGDKYISVYNRLIIFLAREIGNRKTYICSDDEKLSNLASIRQLLNISQNSQINIQQVIPYLKGEKQNTDFYWLFLCWIQSNFPPLEEYLNDLNSLAANTNKGNNTNV